MDPLSISAAVAGFLSLAMDISKILKDYIGGVQSAHEDSQNLLKEVEILCHVLEKLVQFLGSEDLKGKSFDKTSVLQLAVGACQFRLKKLYESLRTLRGATLGSSRIGKLVIRLKWPLKKDEYHQTVAELHRFAQTFQFSLIISNWYVIFDTNLQELSIYSNQIQ
jgi:hypothetical protein